MFGRRFITYTLWILVLSNASMAIGAEKSRLLHAILVVVNGTRITREDLDEAAAAMLRRKYPRHERINLTPEELEELSNAALRELVKINMILDEAEKRNLSVSLEATDKQLNRMNIDPLDATSMERRMVRADLLFDQILVSLGKPRTSPPPGEVKRFYRENKEAFLTRRFIKARHIFIDTVLEKPDVARQKMTLIRNMVLKQRADKQTEFFAEAAKEHSQDRFRSLGGLLRIGPDREGWFIQEFPNKAKDGKPIFPQPMVDGIHNLMRKGELSPIIRSEQGFHLLYLEDTKGGEKMPWNEVQKLIERHLEGKERAIRLRKWLKEKWENSQVLWHDGQLFTLDELLPPEESKQKKNT